MKNCHRARQEIEWCVSRRGVRRVGASQVSKVAAHSFPSGVQEPEAEGSHVPGQRKLPREVEAVGGTLSQSNAQRIV